MTRTEELLKLAANATYPCYPPETIKQLVELVRLQHKVIECISGATAPMLTQQMRQQAIEAFNKWEGK